MSTSLLPLDARTGYLAIAARLRDEVAAGSLVPGGQLPPIQDLAQRFRTTPITVRRALRHLEEEGLVRVEHGVGTFVADWAAEFDALHLPSFSAEMEARAVRVETEVLECRSPVRDAAAARALRRGEGTPLCEMTRRRSAGGAPIVLQHSFLPAELSGLFEECRTGCSLYAVLRERTGSIPVSAEERIRAVVLSAETARLLGGAGTLGWLSERTSLDAAGTPFLFDRAYFAGDRISLRVHRRAGITRLDYELE
jgi:DNA-binding GntR family transcriptional regulator